MTDTQTFFTKDQAQKYLQDRADCIRELDRMNKAKLVDKEKSVMGKREHLFGGPTTRNELIQSILGYLYPLDLTNYATHVVGHLEFWESCPHCATTFFECPDCKGSMRMGLHGRDHDYRH